jgi:hypothetical protein
MSCTGIKQDNNGFIVDRKCTRHYGGSFWKFCKGGEVNSPLPDLHYSLLSLALVVQIRILPLKRLLGPRTILNKVIRTPAIETTISVASLLKLLNVWPCAKLLRLLRRHWRSIPSLLLGRAENQSARWGILLRCSDMCVGNHTIPR